MRLLHLVTYNEKFIPAQLRFLNAEFGQEGQKFYLIGGGGRVRDVLGGNVFYLSWGTLWRFLADAHRCDRLVLNGLYSHGVIAMLLFFPWLLRKAVWVPWGGDLYWPELVAATPWNRFIDRLRGMFFRRLDAIATSTPGDYAKACALYDTKAQYIKSCPNIFSFDRTDLDRLMEKTSQLRKKDAPKIIQVGNSADPSNQHLEMLEWLKPYANESMEICTPLSYGFQGCEGYRDSVVRRGIELFGAKFKPMQHLLDAEAYNQHLASVDVMIFNHRRQQGLGNLAISLYMGTKIYLRRDVSTWGLLVDELGCALSDSCEAKGVSFEQLVYMPVDIRQKNRQAVAHLFDRAWQREIWGRMYLPWQ